MKKQTQKSQPEQPEKIDGTVKAAFQSWLRGEPYSKLKAKLKRPMMALFMELAGVSTWKQAVAKRQKSKASTKEEPRAARRAA